MCICFYKKKNNRLVLYSSNIAEQYIYAAGKTKSPLNGHLATCGKNIRPRFKMLVFCKI